jgi:tetratricopeptide (TPR) repeat protein
MIRDALRRNISLIYLMSVLAFGVASLSAFNADARKPGVTGEAEVKAGNFDQAVQKLEGLDIKGADEYYLLGKAYMGLGKRLEAHKAWTEALHINEGLSKRKKWTFLFPPKRKLKGAQQKKMKEDFEDDYKELSAAVTRLKKNEQRDLKNKATRTRIDAKKLDAKEK